MTRGLLRLLAGVLFVWPLIAHGVGVEIGPAFKTDGVTLQSWRSDQEKQFRALRQRMPSLPPTAAALIRLTPEDSEAIAAANAGTPPGVPHQVGVVRPIGLEIDLSPLRPGLLTDRLWPHAGGWIRRTERQGIAWAMRLDAVNTGGIRLHLADLRLPEGARLYLYNEKGDVRGPYGGQVPSLWTHTIPGDQIYLQLELARPEDAFSVRFRVVEASLLDSSSQAFCPVNAPCIEDGSCFDASDWPFIDTARAAVASILFNRDGGSFVCSGGLLNDTDTASLVPYFLTANHCVSTPSVAATVETRFDYRTASCGGECVWPNVPTTVGAALLNTSPEDDHTLLALDADPPAGAAFLGWTTDPVSGSDGLQLFRLSHPRGSPQAYTDQSVSSTGPTCSGSPRGAYIYSQNQTGAVEGGSSGSVVMNRDGLVVGQLFGVCGTNVGDVCDSDNNRTMDGAFANYFSQIAEWLDPPGFHLTVTRSGTGNGTVTSNPLGIDCGDTCSASFSSGTDVTLAAVAASGSAFEGWAGEGCTGTDACSVSMTQERSLTATFHSLAAELLAGDDPMSDLSGDLDSTMFFSIDVPVGANNLLIEISGGIGDADLHVRFGEPPSLSDYDCRPYLAGNSEQCFFATPFAGVYYVMLHGRTEYSGVTLTASYDAAPVLYELTVAKAGSGDGTVTSSPGGIDCGESCSASFEAGTEITLTANTAPDSAFAGWSDACSGTDNCTLSVTGPLNVAATFDLDAHCPYDDTVALESSVLTGTETYGACQGLVAGPALTLDVGADITFVAGERIVLRPGFLAQTGARLRARLNPDLRR